MSELTILYILIFYILPLVICLLMTMFATNIIGDQYIAGACFAAVIPVFNIIMIVVVIVLFFSDREDKLNNFLKPIFRR
jgi:hypothetical protein